MVAWCCCQSEAKLATTCQQRDEQTPWQRRMARGWKFSSAPSASKSSPQSSQNSDMGMGQNPVPLVNIKIAGKWMSIPLKMVLIGIDPYPHVVHKNGCQTNRKAFGWVYRWSFKKTPTTNPPTVSAHCSCIKCHEFHHCNTSISIHILDSEGISH